MKHINIRYFFCHNRIKAGEVSVKYFPTLDIIVNYFTEPPQGSLFRWFRNLVLGIIEADIPSYQQYYEEIARQRKLEQKQKEQAKKEKAQSFHHQGGIEGPQECVGSPHSPASVHTILPLPSYGRSMNSLTWLANVFHFSQLLLLLILNQVKINRKKVRVMREW